MGALITEETLRGNPVLVKALTGLPAEAFWKLVQDVKAQLNRRRRTTRHCF